MGGVIARQIGFNFTDRGGDSVAEIIADRGAGDNVTADLYQDAGTDSQPLSDDWLAVLQIVGTGKGAVVGVVDPKNAQKAAPGEKRLYSRDGSGQEIAEIWIRNDGAVYLSNEACEFNLEPSGEIRGENDSGYFSLRPDGIFDVNGSLFEPGGIARVADLFIGGGRVAPNRF